MSSIGNAASLRGGTLLMTPLRGIDGEVYGIAQGSLVVSGFGVKGKDGSQHLAQRAISGRMPNGATVEREVPNDFAAQPFVMLNLHTPDFTTAARARRRHQQAAGRRHRAGDGCGVGESGARRRIPTSASPICPRSRAIEIEPGEAPARVIVNSPHGHRGHRLAGARDAGRGGAWLAVGDHHRASGCQPARTRSAQRPDRRHAAQRDLGVTRTQARMFLFNAGVNLDEIVRAVNQVGAAPGDLVAILEALKEAGALRAELIVI